MTGTATDIEEIPGHAGTDPDVEPVGRKIIGIDSRRRPEEIECRGVNRAEDIMNRSHERWRRRR
ncbi:MAG: hypothetical protein H6Q05_4427 [Acidobacteria bacterium]|nr:hypothetical protein [Acidobacteriota bacterium]